MKMSKSIVCSDMNDWSRDSFLMCVVKYCFLFVLLCTGCQTLKVSTGIPQPLPLIDSSDSPVDVALVLGGGGSKGLAHLGVLYELEQAGIYPDLIVGCSSGAIIGALYADQPHMEHLEPLMLRLKRSDLMDFSLFDFKFGLVKGNSLYNFLANQLKSRTFEELKTPLVVVATDLKTGELIELGGGQIIPAIVASAAVPGVFKPVNYLGRYLVDGGVANPIPVDVAKKFHPKVIIAVDVGEDLSDSEPVHLFGIAKRSMEISYRKLSRYVTRSADIVIEMKFQDVGMFSDADNQKIYDHGRQKAREMIPRIRRTLAERLAPADELAFPTWIMIE